MLISPKPARHIPHSSWSRSSGNASREGSNNDLSSYSVTKGNRSGHLFCSRQPSNIDFIILWWFGYCHSWELRLLGSPLGCRVLLLIMSAKHTWTDQEPQLCHFEIITLDLCLQSSWTGVDSCPSEDKQSRCTTVSICRPLSSKIRQATNLFLPALAYKRGFLHITKLWFLVFIFLICALIYSSFVFRNDCNFNMLASFKVVE